MRYDRAIKIAIKALDREIQRVSPDANLFEIWFADCGENASTYRKELREARALLAGQPKLEGLTDR
jgi:hypothetical protein